MTHLLLKHSDPPMSVPSQDILGQTFGILLLVKFCIVTDVALIFTHAHRMQDAAKDTSFSGGVKTCVKPNNYDFNANCGGGYVMTMTQAERVGLNLNFAILDLHIFLTPIMCS